MEGCADEWAKFEFDGIKEMIVLKTSKIAAATEEVCRQNMIPSAKRQDSGGRDGGEEGAAEGDGGSG